MKITLINPNIVSQKEDFSGSGIPYMPVGLAVLAGALREQGHDVHVIDAFGADPRRVVSTQTHFIQGIGADDVAARVPDDTKLLGFFAHLTVTHRALLDIIRAVRARLPSCPSAVIENMILVNAYSLRHVADEFFALGVDYVVLGYPEPRLARVAEAVAAGATARAEDGILSRFEPDIACPPENDAAFDLDGLPPAAWDLFPVENYWHLGYAHAPLTGRRYMALVTSRGCPFNCGFCISPEVTCRQWNARAPERVVDEMAALRERYGVDEFHILDINPTVSRRRVRAFCACLLERGLQVTWKLGQGTKLETLDEETVRLMAQAGCRYISISPESGSPRVLKLMDKPVDLEHAVQVVCWAKQAGITTQNCFVIGYPGETAADRVLTARLVRRMARAGVDEIALFIITPMPGSRVFDEIGDQVESLDQMTFTPTWRSDYPALARYRKALYLQYLAIKLVYHPLRTLGYGWSLLTGRFHTKVEMTIYRKLKVLWYRLRTRC